LKPCVTLLKKLDADDAVSIKEAQKNIFNVSIEKYLAYIKFNFTVLTVSIIELQEQGLPLYEALNIIESVEKAFETLQGSVGTPILNKLNNAVAKNLGLKVLKKYQTYFRVTI